jgi:superfamily I DNA/RNA helicase
MHDEDYLHVLGAINDLEFGVGKDLLASILIGADHDSIERNDLHNNPHYNALAYTESEVHGLIDQCRNNDLIAYQQIPHKPNIYVLALTDDGEAEIDEPTHPITIPDIPHTSQDPTETEQRLINEFNHFLDGYNDAQQRAIISPHQTILCVAGAGTGKTTVLTKRIEHITKHTGTDPDDILAITFTRKARDEMQHRLRQNRVRGVNIHTFNSYAEHIIQTNTDDTIPDLATYPDKLKLLHASLEANGHSTKTAINLYYSDQKQRNTSQNNLINNLLRDTLRLITQSKLNQANPDDLTIKTTEQAFLKTLATTYQDKLNENNRRLHADQILDATTILNARPDTYDHLLIDEYQDINNAQIRLTEAIGHDNLFCVGDPRQSIYGWRGSRITYTTQFTDNHPDATIITLTKNYRSTTKILNAANKTIRPMLLPPVEPTTDKPGTLTTKKHDTKDDEHQYIANKLNDKDHPVLVIARRNKQLDDLSTTLNKHGVQHSHKEDADDTITSTTILATIHAVKGLEAPTVIILGAHSNNHPLRVSDHPLLDQLQPDAYDREAEERRLFYVALTRAQNELIISWTGRKTTYLETPTTTTQDTATKKPTKTAEERLNEWRKEQSQAARIPEFKILPNSTLRKLLDENPDSKDDLHDIWGLTPKRIEKYGDDILHILNKH